MTIKFKPYQVKGQDNKPGDYVTDQGIKLKLNKNFRVPSDLEDETINQILECHDLEERTETAPCPETTNLKPRVIRYIRTNGNSFSLLLPTRTKIVDTAKCVSDLLKETAFPVVCIELVGEHSLNLIEELSPADKAAPTYAPYIAPDATLGKNVLWFSDAMREYKTDTGATVLMPFKSQTDTEDSPYSEIDSVFSSCVSPYTSVSCSGSSAAEYRRYIPIFLTKTPADLEVNQRITVPIKSATDSEILQCGKDLAAKTSVICLEYYGESNKKLQKLIQTA